MASGAYRGRRDSSEWRRPSFVSEPAAMASLLAKDAYLQDLARKICTQPGQEPPRRERGNEGSGESGSGSGLEASEGPQLPAAAASTGWTRPVCECWGKAQACAAAVAAPMPEHPYPQPGLPSWAQGAWGAGAGAPGNCQTQKGFLYTTRSYSLEKIRKLEQVFSTMSLVT